HLAIRSCCQVRWQNLGHSTPGGCDGGKVVSLDVARLSIRVASRSVVAMTDAVSGKDHHDSGATGIGGRLVDRSAGWSVARRLTRARTSARIRTALAETDRDANLPVLAASLANTANALAHEGRLAEALLAAEQAVQLFRELVATDGDSYLPTLAMSVNNLAIRLGEAGRLADALAAAEESVQLRRQLVAGSNAHL